MKYGVLALGYDGTIAQDGVLARGSNLLLPKHVPAESLSLSQLVESCAGSARELVLR